MESRELTLIFNECLKKTLFLQMKVITRQVTIYVITENNRSKIEENDLESRIYVASKEFII